MAFYAVLSLTSAFLCLFLAVIVFYKNTQSLLNRIFSLLCISFSFWGFIEFLSRQSESFERASFWLSYSFTWPITIALLFHFILVYTHSRFLNKKLISYFLIYAPAILFAISDGFFIANHPKLDYWGWTNVVPTTLHTLCANAWACILGITALILMIRFYIHAPNSIIRKQSRILVAGLSIAVFAGSVTVLVEPLLSISVPELSNTAFAIMAALIAYSMWRHNLFTLSTAMAADAIIGTMTDALVVVNTERRIEIVNSALTSMLGYSERDLRGKEIDVILSTQKDSAHTMTRLLRNGTATDVETHFLKKNGDTIPVSLSWSVLRDKAQKLRGIVFIGRDITERERTRASLQNARDELELRVEERTGELSQTNEKLRLEIQERESVEERLASEKEQLAVTLRSIGDGVITCDNEGRIVLVNRAAENLTGWAHGDAEGHFLDEIYNIECINDAEGGLIHKLIERSRYVSGIRNILTARDGTKRSIGERISPVLDITGKPSGWVIVFRDITEQQKFEDEMFKARKLESLSLLASGIAHDFNNILTGIITNLFMAKMGVDPSSDICQLISTAEKSAFRASILTNQLLTFSKDGSSVKENASIKKLIEDSVGFYLSGSKADYSLDLPDDLMTVEVDRGQIDQVLNNIISNADQAMPEGGAILVRAENVTINGTMALPIKEGTYVKIMVTDQGIGIPQDHLVKIFDPYFTTGTTGNGLGLTTAYAIVQHHGGHIEVTSQIGEGTTFIIYLPANDFSEDAAEESHKDEVSTDKWKILLVDDEESIRLSTSMALKHLGYETDSVENAKDAITLYRKAIQEERPYNAVIMDLTITGGMGGEEAVQEILAIDPEAKVILSSGYTNDPIVLNPLSYGFCAAISKPYDLNELGKLITSVANRTITLN